MEKNYLQLMEEIRRWQKGDGDDEKWYSLILVLIILENPTHSKHLKREKRFNACGSLEGVSSKKGFA
jgi:hypothetical protein